MNKLEQEIFERGYVRSPNNIWGLPGDEWYPRGPGLPEAVEGQRVRIFHDQAHVCLDVPNKLEVVRSFDKIADLIEWLKANGRISGPGAPAFANGFD